MEAFTDTLPMLCMGFKTLGCDGKSTHTYNLMVMYYLFSLKNSITSNDAQLLYSSSIYLNPFQKNIFSPTKLKNIFSPTKLTLPVMYMAKHCIQLSPSPTGLIRMDPVTGEFLMV